MNKLDRLKHAIREEFETTGVVTAAAWLADEDALPHRAEIEAYIRSLTGKLDLQARAPHALTSKGRAEMQQMVQAALDKRKAERSSALREGVASATGRQATATRSADAFSPAMVRGSVYGFTARAMSEVRLTLTRMDLQKGAYLLAAALKLDLPLAFSANRWGPHSAALSKDGEHRAREEGWFTLANNPPTLVPREHFADAGNDFALIFGEIELAKALLRHLAALTTPELETLSTVYWCIEHLSPPEESLDADAILRGLPREPRFSEKAAQPNFARPKIDEALKRLAHLGMIQPDRLKT